MPRRPARRRVSCPTSRPGRPDLVLLWQSIPAEFFVALYTVVAGRLVRVPAVAAAQSDGDARLDDRVPRRCPCSPRSATSCSDRASCKRRRFRRSAREGDRVAAARPSMQALSCRRRSRPGTGCRTWREGARAQGEPAAAPLPNSVRLLFDGDDTYGCDRGGLRTPRPARSTSSTTSSNRTRSARAGATCWPAGPPRG